MKKILENASELIQRFQDILSAESEKTSLHMSPRQQMLLHQMPKRQVFMKTQKRLEVIDGFLNNMRTMLQESIDQMSHYHYPVERLTWMVEQGLPALQQKIEQEQNDLHLRFECEFLPPK